MLAYSVFFSSLDKVFELELRCASIETDTRDELTRDMQKRISDMERMFAQRLIQGVCRSFKMLAVVVV